MVTQEEFDPSISYLSIADQDRVAQALTLGRAWHSGQRRDSGEAYITHPIAVAHYLATLEADVDTLIAALLHDVVEDECTTLDNVQREFGNVVAKLVDGVTKLSKVHYEGRRDERQTASLRKMLLTASDDLRVIFIKLADRWHNIRTMDVLTVDKRNRVARETLEIYVPFARLIGLWELKSELENVCFPIVYPVESAEWNASVTQMRMRDQEERHAFIQRINSETGEDVEAHMAAMTDYELYTRLQGNRDRLNDAYNLDTALIIMKEQSALPIDCYRMLGEIHQRYPLRTGSFRDYISNPQPNGYRALHTTIILLPSNNQLRLRIQTQQMNDYSSRRKFSAWLKDRGNDVYSALHSLRLAPPDQEGFKQDLQQEVLQERINVFTPAGEIITLPEEATGIDFAFAMNPDHLNYLSGIRINGTTYEVTHILHEGDIVELVLSQEGKSGQRPMWLRKVKSIEAREGLRRSLQTSPRNAKIEEGRALLDLELRKRRLPNLPFRMATFSMRFASLLGMSSLDEVFERTGEGTLPMSKVIQAYKETLTIQPHFFFSFLQWLGMLPRSRVINREATVMNIRIDAEDRKGLIHDITRCFAERNINIASFEVYATPNRGARYDVHLEVEKFEDFSDLFDTLLQVPSVKGVLRRK